MAIQGIRASGGIQYRDNNTVVAVTAYGAKGDGVTDDTTAITAAVAAANATIGSAKGGVVYFPPGTYLCSSPLVLSSKVAPLQQVKLVGAHGGAVGNPYGPSTILYSGTGATSFMQLNYAREVTVEDLTILYSSSSFTGALVDFSVVTADHNLGGIQNMVSRCTLSSSNQASVWSAAALVSFNNVYASSVKDSHLLFAMVGVALASTNADYANAILIANNRFANLQTAGVTNAGAQVSIVYNTFESNSIGPPNMFPAYIDNRSGGNTAQSLVFSFNWVGDGDGSTNIFDTLSNTTYGLTMEGNNLTGGSVRINSTIGGRITSNYLTNAMLFNAAGSYYGLEVSDNVFAGLAPTFTNVTSAVSLRGNVQNVGTSSVGDNFIVDKMDSSHVGPIQIGSALANQIFFFTGGSQRWTIDSSNASFRPAATNVYDLGSSSDYVANAWVARYVTLPQVIAAATSITVNPANGDKIRINLSGTAISSVTVSAGHDGEIMTIAVAQDATGGRSIPTTWTNVRFAGGTYTATATANKIDVIQFVYDATASAWLEKGRALNA